MSNQNKQELIRRIAYAEKQFFISQQYSMYSHASVVSGACKSKKIFGGDGIEYTDEQKVDAQLHTMHIHIHRMQDIIDTIDDLKEQLDKCNV